MPLGGVARRVVGLGGSGGLPGGFFPSPGPIPGASPRAPGRGWSLRVPLGGVARRVAFSVPVSSRYWGFAPGPGSGGAPGCPLVGWRARVAGPGGWGGVRGGFFASLGLPDSWGFASGARGWAKLARGPLPAPSCGVSAWSRGPGRSPGFGKGRGGERPAAGGSYCATPFRKIS
ncbi:hypothetical protein SMALB_3954 [Streptomyces malaysiensis]|uniref:Uncharacterized protein n=1 Tax=Streptomyces malaysiensis TaxID=92644 RepID=A0A7X5X3M3_STRMQ|nr:hypothetical protein [Streptomyces malaysiensis]